MFIQAIDGKLYEDPVIYGDGYYLQAPGIEYPEIIIKYARTSSLSSSRHLAYKKLKELDIKAKLAKDGDEDIFAFPPEWSGLVKGAKWILQFTDKIPVPQEFKSRIDYPVSSCKFLAWELEFPMQEVLDFLDLKKFNSLLSSFLLGREVIPPLDPKIARSLKTALEKQLKGVPASHKIMLQRMDI